MALSSDEQRIEEAAIVFAKSNRKTIAKRLTAIEDYPPEAEPVAVLMAGSPGAGKTEASIALVARIGSPVLRIDPDELRGEFPGYTGDNARLFQRAVSRVVDAILDRAFNQRQSFLLDGTLASYPSAHKNIERALKDRRFVQILCVYQQPMQAWEFVRAREASEGRRIDPADFVDQYFAAREVVNRLKSEFGKAIHVDLLLKNIDGSNRMYQAGIQNIDHHVPEQFTRRYVENWVAIA